MDDPIRVGIALVERGGCYLVRRRPPLPGSPMPGVWEFPGGKCEPGESPASATVRECLEEAGLTLASSACVNPARTVILTAWSSYTTMIASSKTPPPQPSAESGFSGSRPTS